MIKTVIHTAPYACVLMINNVADEEVLRLVEQLPEWRRQRALAFRSAQQRKESVLAFTLLSEMLAEEFGIQDRLDFDYSEKEKPALRFWPGVQFNLSHCRDAVACVVGSGPVGIDIEMRGRYRPALARRSMDEQELQTINQAEDNDLTFTRLWTRKEALLKLQGEGISGGMKGALRAAEGIEIKTVECGSTVCSLAFSKK